MEATLILLDNSEYARNGDFEGLTRWDAQMEALRYIANNKIESKMENGVGSMLMAGKQI